jgi:hypothetical protein
MGKSDILYQTLSSWNEEFLPLHETVYASVLSSVQKERTETVPQAHVIVGAEGNGKTVLLKRLMSALSACEGFCPCLVEGKTIFEVSEIWRSLGKEFSDFEGLMNWQQEHRQRMVMLMDNVQYLFRRTSPSDQYALRGMLNMAGAPILVATANEVLPAFTDYQSAFFEGFRISYLRQPSESDIQLLAGEKVGSPRGEALRRYLPNTLRSALVVRDILKQSPCKEEDLAFLCDRYTPQYQVKYDACATQVQRILSALSTSESGLTLQGIRDLTGQESGRLSPYLKLMTDQGLIEKEASMKRGATYQISDSLFAVWLRKCLSND